MKLSDPMRGILLMCSAVSLFPFMNAAVKYLSTDFDTPMIIWARYAGHLLCMLIVFMPSRGCRLFASRNLGIQLVRSLLLLAATVCYFSALPYIALATAASISFTSPFIVTALSVPLLGERVGWRRWLAVAVGFIGALIIIRPGSDSLHWAAFLVLGTASCYALYQVLTRKIAASEDTATTLAYTALVGAVLTSIVVPFYWQPPGQPLDLVLFFLIGIVGGIGHYFVVLAFRYGQASLLAPLAYAQLIGATLLGYWVFGDLPDRWTWIGSGIIVGCGLYIGYRETRRKR